MFKFTAVSHVLFTITHISGAPLTYLYIISSFFLLMVIRPFNRTLLIWSASCYPLYPDTQSRKIQPPLWILFVVWSFGIWKYPFFFFSSVTTVFQELYLVLSFFCRTLSEGDISYPFMGIFQDMAKQYATLVS